jgi:hypothetical protein
MSDGIPGMMRDDEDDSVIKYRLRKENNDLKAENEDLKTELIDLTFEMNYNKETELIEFLREVYVSTIIETTGKHSKLTKKEVLLSLKRSIEEFAKNNKISL